MQKCSLQLLLNSQPAFSPPALAQVVRCFEDENVIHVAGRVDPLSDIDVINFELALADIGQIERRLERLTKGRAKTKEEVAAAEVRLLLEWHLAGQCVSLHSAATPAAQSCCLGLVPMTCVIACFKWLGESPMIVAALLCATRDGASPCTVRQTCHPGVMREACHGQQMLAQTVPRTPGGASEQPAGADAQKVLGHHHGAPNTVCRDSMTAGRHDADREGSVGADHGRPGQQRPGAQDAAQRGRAAARARPAAAHHEAGARHFAHLSFRPPCAGLHTPKSSQGLRAEGP
jgi:hypothetical protein